MKNFIKVISAAALAAQSVSGHYIFQALGKGTAKGTPYEFVRRNTNMNSPVTDLSSNDLRCNVGGATGGSTSTLALNAGDQFTFSLDQAVYHQGPVSLYMSKAPSTAAEYDGSGSWFKTFDWGPNFANGQAQWTMTGTYSGTIPKCIPAGEYLLRIQSLAIHNPGAHPAVVCELRPSESLGRRKRDPFANREDPWGFQGIGSWLHCKHLQ
ncbi:hypothetical protein EKO27_g4038 [Xylaria grammica]|uniref:lytic cellulose monooxygenase (C4-dehydrogenating) n=1 Tax=Xylaria grammica TaxID=363999 RepID=A0A439D9J3_9PEZI|nr:hypothetical protein EKO27_g4038 [Xylaria grammica]